MKTFAKTAILALSLAVAGVGTTATTASAGEATFRLSIGPSGGHGWNGGRHRRGFCAPGQALRKARWMGIRQARVVGANHRVVRVRGHKRGHRVGAVFANSWRCPVVAVR